jgi:hypothetical protein
MKKIQIFLVVLAILLVGSIIVISARSAKNRVITPTTDITQTVAGKYDAFATCLKDKGAIFYGAFWCPHCVNNKELFGSSKTLLPYVECSTPDGKDQTQICKDQKITGYPTWKFADGTELSGEVQLVTLAEKTACVLPQ